LSFLLALLALLALLDREAIDCTETSAINSRFTLRPLPKEGASQRNKTYTNCSYTSDSSLHLQTAHLQTAQLQTAHLQTAHLQTAHLQTAHLQTTHFESGLQHNLFTLSWLWSSLARRYFL
jgi:uncharacterized protein YjbI with pentapeptide repeats